MSQQQKVNWIREFTTSNGVVLRISDRTGLIQVKSSSGLGMQGYSDDFMHLFAAMVEVQRYLEENQDVAFSSGQSRESRKIKQVQQRNTTKALNMLTQLDPSILQAALDELKKQA
jgi:hypothetical protein